MSRSTLVVGVVLATLFACGGQEKSESAPPTTVAQAPPTTAQAPPSTAPAPQAQAPEAPAPFTKEQLSELVAPVALYPDVVLASLFPATTYPDQVQDAAAWLKSQGGQADEPPADRNWDG